MRCRATREPAAGAPVVAMSDAATARSVNGLDFGRYYALIIGNQNYSELETCSPRAAMPSAWRNC